MLLSCQLPPEGDRLLFWQIDMRELLDARRRAHVGPNMASFYIEPRMDGGWQLRYQGQVVLDLDVTTINGGWLGHEVPANVVIVLPRNNVDAWLVAVHTNLKDVEEIADPAEALAARDVLRATSNR